MFRDIEVQEREIAGETATVSSSSRQLRTMSWNQAKSRMLAANPSIRQSEQRLADIRRQRRNQWKQWLPRPSLYVNMQQSLRELGRISGNDLTGAFLAPLSIPNPVSEQAAALQYALMEVQAEASHEMLVRRETVSLYRIFSQWESTPATTSTSGGSVEELIQQRLREAESGALLTENHQMIRGQISRSLNLPGIDVTPIPETRPKLDYSAKLGSLVPGRNYGLLATRLAAYEIQASILRRKGVEMSRWSVPQLNTSTPPIYDSSRPDNSVLADFDRIALFGGWNQTVDLTGAQTARIESARENVIFVRQALSVRLDSEARQWQRLQRRYEAVSAKQRVLNIRAARIARRNSAAGNLEADLADSRRIFGELNQLRKAKEELDLELWLWDDEAWGTRS